jgi:hypothetical protein
MDHMSVGGSEVVLGVDSYSWVADSSFITLGRSASWPWVIVNGCFEGWEGDKYAIAFRSCGCKPCVHSIEGREFFICHLCEERCARVHGVVSWIGEDCERGNKAFKKTGSIFQS